MGKLDKFLAIQNEREQIFDEEAQKFLDSLLRVQKKAYRRLRTEVANFKISGGKILRTNPNLRVAIRSNQKIIKILNDKGLLKNVNEYTRYLALLKKGKIQKIDEDLLRVMLNKVRLTKVKPSERIKTYIKDFLDGSSSLCDIDTVLYNFAKKNKICDEYKLLFKRIKGDTTDDVVDDKPKQPTQPKQPTHKKEIKNLSLHLIH